jgi:hypothetical protein
MNGDTALLDSIPDYLFVSDLLKAMPATEGNDRFVYLEASNEALDQQGEVVLAKALKESADYYLRFGNLDIDHFTQIGAKAGIPNYEQYEIGRPVEVKVDGTRTFVKGQIYQGEGPVAEKANSFWDSLTKLSPPQRWYPSVGGQILEKGVEFDPETKSRKAIIRKVRWSNIGFSKTPVNANLPTVETVPFGALAKSWGAAGLDLRKALTAGYGTDSASLTGGAALRQQSLQGVLNYHDFRNRLAEAMRAGQAGNNPGARALVDVAQKRFGLSVDQAAEWVERFMSDIKSYLITRRKQR